MCYLIFYQHSTETNTKCQINRIDAKFNISDEEIFQTFMVTYRKFCTLQCTRSIFFLSFEKNKHHNKYVYNVDN